MAIARLGVTAAQVKAAKAAAEAKPAAKSPAPAAQSESLLVTRVMWEISMPDDTRANLIAALAAEGITDCNVADLSNSDLKSLGFPTMALAIELKKRVAALLQQQQQHFSNHATSKPSADGTTVIDSSSGGGDSPSGVSRLSFSSCPLMRRALANAGASSYLSAIVRDGWGDSDLLPLSKMSEETLNHRFGMSQRVAKAMKSALEEVAAEVSRHGGGGDGDGDGDDDAPDDMTDQCRPAVSFLPLAPFSACLTQITQLQCNSHILLMYFTMEILRDPVIAADGFTCSAPLLPPSLSASATHNPTRKLLF